MITLFENFANDFKIKDYIKKEGDIFKIPNVKFKLFSEGYLKKPQFYTQIKYNTLMRLFLYVKLLRYKGNSPMILSYVKGLKEKDPKKIEIINKIPNNNNILRLINKLFGFGYPKYDYDNLQDLKKLIFKWEEVLSDRNLLEYISVIFEASKSAGKSEKIVKGVLTMLYSKYYEVTYAKLSEDLKGMDLWKINKETGERQSIQVKNIRGNVKFNFKDDVIYINNTGIDLHNYQCWTDKLPYDYVAFYLESEQKIIIIKSTAIFSIDRNEEKRFIKIKLKNWAMKPDFYSKVIKSVDVPKKFTGQDVSQIFYNPELELELQEKVPDIINEPEK